MGKVKIINTDTGELQELEWDSWAEFADAWEELNRWSAAIEKAKTEMKAEVLAGMGQDATLETGHPDGYYFKRVTQERKSYDPTVVADVFGDDAIRFMKVDKKKLDLELSEHIEDDGIWPTYAKRLRENMVTDSVVEFPRLEKPKRK